MLQTTKTPRRLLILEDETVLAKNIAKYLERHGYLTRTAGSVLDANRELREERIDAVLLDINLPDCNGFDFYEHIRVDYTHLRAVAMSGRTTFEYQSRAKKLEIDSFLSKPFPLSEMLNAVNLLFEHNGNDTPPTIPTLPGGQSVSKLTPKRAARTGNPQEISNRGASRGQRILMYSHDTFGLGNIRRMLTIATDLVESSENISVLLLSGSPMVHAFRISPRIDYVKLPCVKRNLNGDYAVRSLELDYQDTLRLRSNLILSTTLDYHPDLIIVDKKPFGLDDELVTTLQALEQRSRCPKLLLLLRDILDTPESTIRSWRENGYYEAIERFYDRILVVGLRDVFDICTKYHFPNASANKVEFCGYLNRGQPQISPDVIRDRVGLSNEPLVFATAGGGEDGFELLSCYAQGLLNMGSGEAPKTLMMCGPEMAPLHFEKLEALAHRCSTLTLKHFTDDVLSYMNAADLVVSMGGYNTICEILTLNKPAIVVPRVRPVQEQWLRAKKLASMNLLHLIHPDHLTPSGLMRVAQKLLTNPSHLKNNAKRINLSGLLKIRNIVTEELKQAATNNVVAVQNKAEVAPVRYATDGLN
ncbi:MAG: response regulator [Gammaproteobacteria bacterium]|nr:response regulator [Gammaproteobacteria bacterium]